MYSINVTDELGNSRSIDFEAGLSLMEVLREAGYEQILAMCGGCCSCATCHVHIAAGQEDRLPEKEDDEAMLLEIADNYQPELSRLSCQIELGAAHDGLNVILVEND